MEDKRPTVAIVGAGFGGLRVAQALRNAPVNVVLVDRRNYHLFQPLLYQVATAGLAPAEIAYPVRSILRNQKNLEFRLRNVERVDLENRQLICGSGALKYDYLILAMGAETNFHGMDTVAQHSFGLKDLDDAVAIRNHVLRMFEMAAQESIPEKRREMLTFVVVGGGPTGVESAGALAELTRLVQLKDFAELQPQELRVVLLEASNELLAGMSPELQEATGETLWRKHVEVRFGARVLGYDGKVVQLANGENIPTQTMIWAAGAKAARLADTLGAPQGAMGRVLVEPTLQIPGHPEAFLIGDASHWEQDGEMVPMIAPLAIQQADLAAGNVQRLIKSQELEDFEYKSPGAMATIGRNAAVAEVGRFRFRGFPAWVVWLLVHLMRLVGFRNRIVVLINWAWDYIFYDRAVRIIMPEGRWPWNEPTETDK